MPPPVPPSQRNRVPETRPAPPGISVAPAVPQLQSQPPQRQSARWEFRSVVLDLPNQDAVLCTLGTDGWEVVAMSATTVANPAYIEEAAERQRIVCSGGFVDPRAKELPVLARTLVLLKRVLP